MTDEELDLLDQQDEDEKDKSRSLADADEIMPSPRDPDQPRSIAPEESTEGSLGEANTAMPPPVDPALKSITGMSNSPVTPPKSITASPLEGSQPLSASQATTPPAMAPRPAADALEKLREGQAPISKKHGIGGGFLKALETVGTILTPNAMAAIPGTRANYAMQTRNAQGAANEEDKLLGSEGAAQNQESEAELRKAQAGQFAMVPMELPDGTTIQVQQKDLAKLQSTLQTNATKKDTTASTNTSHENIATGKNATAEDIAGGKNQTAEDIAKGHDASHLQVAQYTGRIRAEIAAANRDLQQWKVNQKGANIPPLVGKAKDTLEDSVSRLNVMQENLEEGMKGDQQAMLSLLANHLGMTMGLAKGARINQAIIKEAQDSAPWLGRINAKFDDRGYLTGVTLTPDQMTSMVGLAHGRLSEDRRKLQEMQDFYKTNGGNTGGGGGEQHPVGTIRTSKKTGKSDVWDGSTWQSQTQK